MITASHLLSFSYYLPASSLFFVFLISSFLLVTNTSSGILISGIFTSSAVIASISYSSIFKSLLSSLYFYVCLVLPLHS